MRGVGEEGHSVCHNYMVPRAPYQCVSSQLHKCPMCICLGMTTFANPFLNSQFALEARMQRNKFVAFFPPTKQRVGENQQVFWLIQANGRLYCHLSIPKSLSMPPNWVNLTRYPFGKRLNNLPIEALQTNFEMHPSFQVFNCFYPPCHSPSLQLHSKMS